MKHLAPAAIAALLILTACASSETDAPDPVGIGISCETSSGEPTRFAAPQDAWELPPEEREECGGFWVGDTPDAAQQHKYTDLEREALEAANAREQLLPDLYGRCAESQLRFHNDESWETADETGSSEVSPLEQLQGALLLCPDHPDADNVKERAAEVEAQQEQTH